MRTMLVVNKIDLVEDGFELNVPATWKKMPIIKVSALFGSGLNTLKDMIARRTLGDPVIELKDAVVPNLRHKNALLKSLELLMSARDEIRKDTSFELIAIDVREALSRLDEISGTTVKEDVLDHIFSRFCIGK
jgi:tRNA modification GTPase